MSTMFEALTWYPPAAWDRGDPDDAHLMLSGGCGHCGARGLRMLIASAGGGQQVDGVSHGSGGGRFWAICHACHMPSAVTSDGQWPPPDAGRAIANLPQDVAQAYDEARRAFGARCFSACEMVCRRILVHLAVDKGASEWEKGKQFARYVQEFDDAGWLTVGTRPVADRVRERGNAANHELVVVTREQAKETLHLTALLLEEAYLDHGADSAT